MIKIVTDSTCDLTPEVLAEMGVTVVPLYVLFGTKSYREMTDLSPDEFFRKLAESDVIPTTSMPSPGDFLKAYEPLVAAGHSVISIHIGGQLSGTVQSARQARDLLLEDYEDADITVIDSRSTTHGLGIMLQKAVEMVREGKDKDRIAAEMEEIAEGNYAVLLTTDLEHLKKSGRINSVQAFLGGIMKMVPLALLEKGKLQPHGKALGIKAGLKQLENCLEAKTKGKQIRYIVVVSAENTEARDYLLENLHRNYPDVPVSSGKIGAVIGTHLGSSAVGILWSGK